jgi:hypothetical protein
MTRITRTLTAAGLALSIAIGAVGASATPARANNDDGHRHHRRSHRALCLGQVIQNSNGNVTVTRNSGTGPAGGRRTSSIVPGSWWHPRAASSRGATNGSIAAMSGAACRTTSRAPPLLPQNCLRRVETQRGPRMIYGGRCLANNGWVREAGFRN